MITQVKCVCNYSHLTTIGKKAPLLEWVEKTPPPLTAVLERSYQKQFQVLVEQLENETMELLLKH